MALAVVSLLAGAVISVILAFLAASNITPLPILAAAIKGIVAVIRAVPALVSVSYTHLDVYKRQAIEIYAAFKMQIK